MYSGEIQNDTDEAVEHRFFDKESIPDNLNICDKKAILDWVKEPNQVIVN